jgi:hypothetical protein
MDPYLEGPLWMSVHTQLSAEIARQLAPKLRPRYLALTTERFLLESPDSVTVTPVTLFPDVAVARSGRETAARGGLALAPPPLRLETVMPVPVPHVSIEIRDTARRQLVTVIEVLSPTNKRGSGYEEYLAKRQRILMSSSHLLEIDLLHHGRRAPMKGPLPEVPYFVFLSRAGERPFTEIWPIALPERLPEVPVPLLEALSKRG